MSEIRWAAKAREQSTTTMLLTLNATSLRFQLEQDNEACSMDLTDVPGFALEQLLLRGLVVDTSLLKGWSIEALDQLRNRADQAACPCLVLRESSPVGAHVDDADEIDATMSRVGLVARAAQRLGCNAMALQLEGFKGESDFSRTAVFLKRVMEGIDRMELNLLVEPGEGMLAEPEALIQLVKKVGGFRIGTMPSFSNAIASGDPESTLRQTAPYAGAILASCGWSAVAATPVKSSGRSKRGANDEAEEDRSDLTLTEREAEQIEICVNAICNVGYGQILAIDYVGSGDGVSIIEGTRSLIEEIMERE